VRGLLLSSCAAFLFAPWWQASFDGRALNLPPDVKAQLQAGGAVSGWKTVRDALGELDLSKPWLGLSPLRGPGHVSQDLQSVRTGAILMFLAPLGYALGLVLAIPVAVLAWRQDGKHAAWPFVVCTICLVLFIAGWHILASAEAAGRLIDAAGQAGLSMGVSTWSYVMFFLLVPMCIISCGRPNRGFTTVTAWDHELQRSGEVT
jgi:hypothetical protein